MAFYQINHIRKIPATITEVWEFISSPGNLKEMMPSNMDLIITSNNATEKMYAGMIITYKVNPLAGISLTWVTEITQVREKEFFVDEQRMGPFKMWHHQHIIKAIEGGVLMTDIVSYQPPLGILGSLINSILIKHKLKTILDSRNIALEKRFGVYK